MRLRLLMLAVCAFGSNSARADESFVRRLTRDLAGRVPPEVVIDRHVDAAIKDATVTAAPQADDATLVRRLTLDLVGRVPTAGETDAYVKSTAPDKRAKLVDRLLASPGFVRHQAAMFESMLNPEGDRRGGTALREYLAGALKADKTWDAIFRELLLPDESNAKTKGAGEFLRARVADADKMTNDVSVAFFGVNVSCAQCHDHPLVKDWTQDHFYGMKAFLSRTFDNGGFLGERGYGSVKYKPHKGPEKTAAMMFLTGAKIPAVGKEPTPAEMKDEKAALDKAKAAKTAPPKPAFSARAKLVEVSLTSDNADFFARSIANRMWHRFFGAGLVNPLDQMHSENPASHPELLAYLARDTADNGYDLKRLIRGIVMSKAYSRSSQYPTASPPDPRLFAVARLKPLTPMQLATSMKIARTAPDTLDGKKLDEFEKAVEQLESSARGFAGLIAQPTDNFQIGVGEALLFSNGDRVMKEFLTDATDTVLGKVKAMTEPKEAVAYLVKCVHGRPATENELQALTGYVTKRKDRLGDAYRQVLWALVTGPEFRFNY